VHVPPAVVMVAPPEVPRNAQRRAQRKAAPKRMWPPGAANDSIKVGPRRTGVSHLEHSEKVLSFARIATTLLHERLPWVTSLLYPTASERGECMLAMLFWVLAALAVVGALATVWGLYLLVRRWL
jgi:hypothetical protein